MSLVKHSATCLVLMLPGTCAGDVSTPTFANRGTHLDQLFSQNTFDPFGMFVAWRDFGGAPLPSGVYQTSSCLDGYYYSSGSGTLDIRVATGLSGGSTDFDPLEELNQTIARLTETKVERLGDFTWHFYDGPSVSAPYGYDGWASYLIQKVQISIATSEPLDFTISLPTESTIDSRIKQLALGVPEPGPAVLLGAGLALLGLLGARQRATGEQATLRDLHPACSPDGP